MRKSINKNQKCCALCRKWNNGRGADSMQPCGGITWQIDSDETHPCMVNGVKRNGLFGLGCQYFESKF